MPGIVQLVLLLAELAPSMLKIYRTFKQAKGPMTADDRKRIAASVKDQVATQKTGDLEHFLTKTEPPDHSG